MYVIMKFHEVSIFFTSEIKQIGSMQTVHHFQTQPHEFDSRWQVVSMGERYAFGVDEPWKAWVAYAKAGWDTITRQTERLPTIPTGPQFSANNVTCAGILSNDGTATRTMSLMQTKHLACPTLVTAVFQMVPQPF